MAQQKTMTTCPDCGAKVRKDKLRGHVERVHDKGAAAGARPKQETSRPVKPKIRGKKKMGRWPAIALVIIMALSSLGAYAILTQHPQNRKAVIATSMGTFTMELYEDRAPRTAGNFIRLAQAGFYNGLIFHRVVADFVIQGGDPNGDGTGGSGQTVDWENTGLTNVKYTVAMARSGDPNSPQGANTATSQFFVNLKDNPSLDSYTYRFVVFGKVISGQSIVDAIGQVSVDSNDKPFTPVVMNTVTITS
jgi:cyclophilin family peptidyl-prolyl cis-trans isomerase